MEELQKRLTEASAQVESLSGLMEGLQREMKTQELEIRELRERAVKLTQASKQQSQTGGDAALVKSLKERVAELEATVVTLRQTLSLREITPLPTIAPVFYGLSDAAMGKEYQRVCAAVQAARKADPMSVFRLTGHSNHEGLEEVNYRQSAVRAQALATFLIGRGVPAQQLQVVAAGSTHPLYPADSAAGRQQNRRVTIELVTK